MDTPTPTDQQTPTPTWTVDDFIDWMEGQGQIVPPFSADERSLATAVAEAYFFSYKLTELPARAPLHGAAWACMGLGIQRVKGFCRKVSFSRVLASVSH